MDSDPIDEANQISEAVAQFHKRSGEQAAALAKLLAKTGPLSVDGRTYRLRKVTASGTVINTKVLYNPNRGTTSAPYDKEEPVTWKFDVVSQGRWVLSPIEKPEKAHKFNGMRSLYRRMASDDVRRQLDQDFPALVEQAKARTNFLR